MSMKCPVCDSPAYVLDSRPRKGNQTYRRYRCEKLHRWTTLEKVVRLKDDPEQLGLFKEK